ncbi:MAG: MFS transporter [Ignavibacteriae bacterium]|nr:MFS transporter [Ignavibacteriota bacterium]MCB9206901.1 MFS transporter [Ignavibacteriales bacterium]MCB9209808.1 MFS transporter [Ignavibacteriales bacterium]MCB9218964.1 MFS transporter [Ignavibacteriales bacterium]
MLEIQKKLTNTFYAILSLPATAMGFALSVQISALSWILVTQFGLDLHEMGFVWAAGPIAGLIAQPIVGFISDSVWFWGGRRRPFILIGGTLAALMLLALPNIGIINETLSLGSLIAIAMVVALTLDLSINVSFNPTRSLISDVTPVGRTRTKGYTWMQTVSGTFGVLAYAIGAIFGNYFLIYFGAVLVFVFTLVPSLFIEEPKSLETEATEIEKHSSKTNLPEFLKVCFANAFSWLGVQTMFVYIIAFITQKINPIPEGASTETISILNDKTGQIISISFLVLNAVGALLPAFVLNPLAEKIGRVKTQMMSVAVMSIGYFCIAFFGHSEYSLYFLMGIAGIGWAAIVSLPFAIMSETVNQSRMGFFMGMFNLSIVIPQLLVSLLFGVLIQSADDKNIVFLISGVTLALSAITWLLVKEQYSSQKE